MDENELEEIKKLYATYHRLWWCFKRVYQVEKRRDLMEKVSSSFLVVCGVVAGAITMNPVILGVISGAGLILKTIQEAGNRSRKIEKARFAFTNYEKALSDLRFALRGGKFDREKFLVEMQTIDEIIISLALNQEKFESQWKLNFQEENGRRASLRLNQESKKDHSGKESFRSVSFRGSKADFCSDNLSRVGKRSGEIHSCGKHFEE